MKSNKVKFWKLIVIFILIITFLDIFNSLIQLHFNFSEYLLIAQSSYSSYLYESVVIIICGAITFQFTDTQNEITTKTIISRMFIYMVSYIIGSTFLIIGIRLYFKEPFSYNLFDDTLIFFKYSVYQGALFNLTWVSIGRKSSEVVE